MIHIFRITITHQGSTCSPFPQILPPFFRCLPLLPPHGRPPCPSCVIGHDRKAPPVKPRSARVNQREGPANRSMGEPGCLESHPPPPPLPGGREPWPPGQPAPRYLAARTGRPG